MNVFQYSANAQARFTNALMECSGYKTISTFYGDLSIGEWYGTKSLKETFDTIVSSWIGDYKMFTEFIMALNWKIWEFYDKGNEDVARLYNDLWEKAQDAFFKKYEGNEEATDYYYRVTD